MRASKLIHSNVGHIVSALEIKRLNLTGFVTSARQHHNRTLFRFVHESFSATHVPDIRGPEIENDQVRSLAQKLKRSLAVGRLENLNKPCVVRPIRKSLRMGGSSSMTNTLSGAAVMRRLSNCCGFCRNRQLIVNNRPGPIRPVSRGNGAVHALTKPSRNPEKPGALPAPDPLLNP